MSDRNAKTLVICPIGLGNFMMMTPALQHLSQHLGKAHLHMLALKPGIRQMAEATGYFNKVFHWDPDKESLSRGLAVLRRFRQEQYRNLVSLFPSPNWKGSLFSRFVGAKNRIGFAYPHSRLPSLIQQESLPLDLDAHDTDQNLRLAAKITGQPPPSSIRLNFPIPPGYSQKEVLKTENYYVCHPGSSAEREMIYKRLPPESFAAFIRKIHREFGLKCLLIGGPEEKDLRDQIQTLVSPETLLNVPSRSLSELAGQVVHARFFLGNDSGLMHISAALEVRCIAFWGPTDEKRSGPYRYWKSVNGQPLHLILRRQDLSCTPCWTIKTVGNNPPCQFGDIRCLTQMETDSVWPRIKNFIASLD